MKREKLSISAFAALAKVAPSTLRFYKHRAEQARRDGKDRAGLLPKPDGHEEVSGTPWWYRETAQEWVDNRVGRGRRTDLPHS